jgi:hypothetical protein
MMNQKTSQEVRNSRMHQTVKVIFGSESGFASKRAQKQTLREILSIKPVVPRPLQWSVLPISFSRDDQWTSFSKLGKFPLVLIPVVASVRLTRVLIMEEAASIFSSQVLRKMGLDITDMLSHPKIFNFRM